MKSSISCLICRVTIPRYHSGKKLKRKYCSTKCAGEGLRRKHRPPKGKDWCSTHQAYLPVREFSPASTRKQCRVCSSAYDTVRANRLKVQAIELLGGGCSSCGYNKHHAALDIHHPDKKSDNWTGLRKRTWEFIQATLIQERCVLLCSNCHRERHFRQM